MDNTGAVYVTGNAYVVSGDSRCTTIKYSSTGVPLWTNIYSASGTGGRALAMDASGDVVITSSLGSGYLTLKYSGAGALLWARTYTGPANANDLAYALAVDTSGNVLVTGYSTGSGSGQDYATIKYSSTGVPLWTNRYNGPGNGWDEAYAIAVDASGNVVVTGRSSNGTNLDYATIQYSSAGVPLWTNRYGRPSNIDDAARSVAVGTSSNVVVTGTSGTIQYSSAGVPLWTNLATASVSGTVTAMTLDSSGNAYVADFSAGGGSDYVTIALSSAGVSLWTNRYNGPGNGGDTARAVAVDASGSVYVTGYSTGNGSGQDFATVKYVVAPIIARQPLSGINPVGTIATFTVEAVGGLPLIYQWRRDGTNLVNGSNLSGVTTTNLQIANVQLGDAAGYTVVVTNAYGSTTSSVAQLTVTVPPNPGRFTSLSYSPAMGFSFIFRDATVGQPYRIQRSPSMAEGSWTNWQSFTYTEPTGFMDVGATGAERRFYRAVSP